MSKLMASLQLSCILAASTGDMEPLFNLIDQAERAGMSETHLAWLVIEGYRRAEKLQPNYAASTGRSVPVGFASVVG